MDALISNHKPVSYLDIDAEQGVMTLSLFPIPLYVKSLRAFLGGEEHLESNTKGGRIMRIDQQLAEKWIKPGSSVLDLGCGDGELLAQISKKHGIRFIRIRN